MRPTIKHKKEQDISTLQLVATKNREMFKKDDEGQYKCCVTKNNEQKKLNRPKTQLRVKVQVAPMHTAHFSLASKN